MKKVNSSTYYLMRWTTLHDKNAKEIFSGDILKDSHEGVWFVNGLNYVHADSTRGSVLAMACSMWVTDVKSYYIGEKGEPIYDKKEEIAFLSEVCSDSEVIGNIYKNPELLEPN